MTAPVPAYVRTAKYDSNHDGDTLVMVLDHGRYPDCQVMSAQPLRVRGLFCPELSEPGGNEARDFVTGLCKAAKVIVVQTYRGSFARTVADVWLDGKLLSDTVIEAGHGKNKA